MITHLELTEFLYYNPDNGLFYWKKPRQKIKIGAVAGCLNKKGYVSLEIKGKYYSAHRLAWFYVKGQIPLKQIDHINGNKSDNRICNLREATHAQNRANSKNFNKYGLKGVNYKPHLKNKPWTAQITYNKKVKHLGCYATKEEAHKAYCIAAKELHKEFFHS